MHRGLRAGRLLFRARVHHILLLSIIRFYDLYRPASLSRTRGCLRPGCTEAGALPALRRGLRGACSPRLARTCVVPATPPWQQLGDVVPRSRRGTCGRRGGCSQRTGCANTAEQPRGSRPAKLHRRSLAKCTRSASSRRLGLIQSVVLLSVSPAQAASGRLLPALRRFLPDDSKQSATAPSVVTDRWRCHDVLHLCQC